MKWDLYAIFLESLVKNIFFLKKKQKKPNQNNVCTVQFIVLFAALRAWFYKTTASQNTVLNYGSEDCPRVFSEIWSLCWHLVTIN